jgi:hypothetical protein
MYGAMAILEWCLAYERDDNGLRTLGMESTEQ